MAAAWAAALAEVELAAADLAEACLSTLRGHTQLEHLDLGLSGLWLTARPATRREPEVTGQPLPAWLGELPRLA